MYLISGKLRCIGEGDLRFYGGTVGCAGCGQVPPPLVDYYSNLDDLCTALNLDRKALEITLGAIDFQYDPKTNSFL